MVFSALSEAFHRASASARSSGSLAFIDADCEGIGGAVLRILREFSRFDLAIVAAASLPVDHPSGARASAIALIAAFGMPAKLAQRIDGVLARVLIAWHFGGRCDYKELADIHGIDPDTVRRRAHVVRDALALEEDAIWKRLASRLRDIGALPTGTPFARGS